MGALWLPPLPCTGDIDGFARRILYRFDIHIGDIMERYYDFAIPNRIARVQTESEITDLINKWNGVMNCYLSVNPYSVISVDEFDNEIRSAYITKAFFDFDHDVDSVKKMTEYLLSKDIKFELNHSGNGHHIYIHLTGEGNGQNLRILQLSILNEAKATCDMHVVGDTQRVSRLPNTWNLKSNTYCIPIHVEEIGKEDGSKQRIGERYIYGTKLLDLSTFTEDKFEYIKADVLKDMKIDSDIPLIPCIKNIISKINPNQTERYTLVVYLSNALRAGRDLRYFDQVFLADELKNFFLTNCQHWMDFDIGKTMYQVRNILPKTNIICGCHFLKGKGVCIGCIKGGL